MRTSDRFDITEAVDVLLGEKPLEQRAITLFQLQVALSTCDARVRAKDRLVIKCEQELLEQAFGIAAFSILLSRPINNGPISKFEHKLGVILDITQRFMKVAKRGASDIPWLSAHAERRSFQSELRKWVGEACSAIPFWDYSINASDSNFQGRKKAGLSSALVYLSAFKAETEKDRLRFNIQGQTYTKALERQYRPVAGFLYVAYTYKYPLLPYLGSWSALGSELLLAAEDQGLLREAFGRVMSANEILNRRGYKDVCVEFSTSVTKVPLPPDPLPEEKSETIHFG